LALALLAVFPDALDRTSLWIGIAYPPTTLFLVAITLLLLVAVHFSWELSRLEERTRVLAEELALLRAQTAKEITLTEEETETSSPDRVER
jgi:hypothetical protein